MARKPVSAGTERHAKRHRKQRQHARRESPDTQTVEQEPSDDASARDCRIPCRNKHGLGEIGRRARGLGARRLKQRRAAAKGQAPMYSNISRLVNSHCMDLIS